MEGRWQGLVLGASSYSGAVMVGGVNVLIEEDRLNAAVCIIVDHPIFGPGIICGGGNLKKK